MEQEDYGLQQIHKQLLRTLDVFDEACRKNGVAYALHGGTLLGAVRNGRMIPWDDDVDVSMTRENYNRFRQIRDERYRIVEDELCVARFVLNDAADADCVCVDILIWDYISANRFARLLKINLLRFLQGTIKKNIPYEKYNLWGKLAAWISHVAGLPFPMRLKYKLYHRVEERWFVGKKQYIHRSNDTFFSIGHVYDADFMEHYEEIELEGRRYLVNTRYVEFLVRSYGEDYLTPPPVSQRVPQHEIIRRELRQK